MIIPISRQPVVFKPKDSTQGDCTPSQYCQLVQMNDLLCFQLRQESCMPQILCNNDFTKFGIDIIAGAGDFYYEQDVSLHFFEADPDTWAYDPYGKRVCTIDSHAGGDLFWSLTYGNQQLTCLLTIKFTVSEHDDAASETVNDYLLVTLPDGTTQTIVNNGTYTLTSYTGPLLVFTPGSGWSGCLDDITMRCSGTCWVWDQPNAIQFLGDGLYKTAGAAQVTVTEESPSLVNGKYYKVIIETDQMISGQVEVFLGSQSIGVVTSDGIYSMYGIASGTSLSFVLSQDFGGFVRSVSLWQLTQDLVLKLYTANNVELKDYTTSLKYNGEVIEACISFEKGFDDSYPDIPNDPGCWYFELTTPEDGNIITNGSFFTDDIISIADNWTTNGTLALDYSIGQASYLSGSGYLLQNLGIDITPGNMYYLSFEIRCIDETTNFDSFSAFIGCGPTGAGGITAWGMTDFPQQVGKYIYQVVAGSDGTYIGFYFTDVYDMTKLCITNIRLMTTPCEQQVLDSNCIKFGQYEGSKVFVACNEDAESEGFDWSTGFKLRARLYADFIVPNYPTRKDITYLFSNGKRKRIYAELAKQMELIIHEVDELTHDYIALMLKADQLFINPDYSMTDRYMDIEGEYTPEWDKKGQKAVAEARTTVEKFDSTLFNTNDK